MSGLKGTSRFYLNQLLISKVEKVYNRFQLPWRLSKLSWLSQTQSMKKERLHPRVPLSSTAPHSIMFMIQLASLSQLTFFKFFVSVHKWNFLKVEDFLKIALLYVIHLIFQKINQVDEKLDCFAATYFQKPHLLREISSFIALSNWSNVKKPFLSFSKCGLELEKPNTSREDQILFYQKET